MRRIVSSFLMLLTFCLLRPAVAEDAKQIRQLIPAAAAMSKADMEKLATSEAPSYDDIEDKSFTLQVLAMKLNKDRSDEQVEEFQMLTETPKPSDLAAEMYRVRRIGQLKIPLGPVTAIHPERITDFTCDVKEDTARGTVSFKVPELYQGKVSYVARKKGDKWRVEEFLLPAHKIHIARGDDGRWREQE